MPFLETQLMEIKLAADKLLLDLQFAVSRWALALAGAPRSCHWCHNLA
jgi:pyruvate-formate lyase-activating enzyme